jgi:hypothetical protein
MYKEVREGEVYKHFKGNYYVVVGISRWHDGGARLVEYRSIETGEKWSRPYDDFVRYKALDSGVVKRFEKVVL